LQARKEPDNRDFCGVLAAKIHYLSRLSGTASSPVPELVEGLETRINQRFPTENNMKKYGMVAGVRWLAAVFILSTIAGVIAAQESPVPEWVSEVPPEDAFWGIGSAKLENESLAQQIAASLARRNLAEQLGIWGRFILFKYINEDGTLTGKLLSKEIIDADLSGVAINARKRTADGTWWVRVSLPKADAQKIRNYAIDNTADRILELKTQEPLPGDIPEWISEVPPEDAFWGIGYVNLENKDLALWVAATLSWKDVAMQLSILVQSMLNDYAGEAETLISENITSKIAEVDFSGGLINTCEQTADGTWWVRVSLPKVEAREFINDIIGSEAARFADLKAQEVLKLLDAQLEREPEFRSRD
jgi:hypothetical protein